VGARGVRSSRLRRRRLLAGGLGRPRRRLLRDDLRWADGRTESARLLPRALPRNCVTPRKNFDGETRFPFGPWPDPYLDRPLKSGLSPARIAFTATACPPMFRKLPHINGSNSFLVIVSLLVRISIINCTPEGETRFPFGPWPDPRMSKRPARHCSFRIALCGAILAIRRSTRAIPRSMRSNRSSM
jgi:hypothetical protein